MNTRSGARGLPPSWTEAGPPDRMMPLGPGQSSALSADWKGTISEYTPASRMRRAMSWVTWEPKSMMRIRSCMAGV